MRQTRILFISLLLLLSFQNSFSQLTAKKYFESGVAKVFSGDSRSAIRDFDKALELDAKGTTFKLVDAYNFRGIEKYKIKDFYGAINDFNKSIALNPNDAVTYYNRGLAKSDLKNNEDAIIDYSTAIKLNPNYGIAYMNRAVARGLSNDTKNACSDFHKAAELGISDAYRAIRTFCK